MRDHKDNFRNISEKLLQIDLLILESITKLNIQDQVNPNMHSYTLL